MKQDNKGKKVSKSIKTMKATLQKMVLANALG